MRKQGLQEVSRGRKTTTIPDPTRPPRQCQPQVQGGRPRSAPGRRLPLCAHRDRNGLRRPRHQRLRSKNRRMARLDLDDGQLNPRRAQLGHLLTMSRTERFDPPLGPRQAMLVHPIRRAVRRNRNRHVGWERRKQLRQRTGRNRHRIAQDRVRQAPRPVENRRPP